MKINCQNLLMSPTIFREGKYRFFFFSREEERMHVHVVSPEGEAKFWIEPTVALADFIWFEQKAAFTTSENCGEQKR